MVDFLLTHVLTLSATDARIKILLLTRIELPTSALIIDHSGDECVCVLLCVFFPFILDVKLVDVPAGVTQEEDHTGFPIHLPSAVLALIFPREKDSAAFLSLVDREVEFCVLITMSSLSTCWA